VRISVRLLLCEAALRCEARGIWISMSSSFPYKDIFMEVWRRLEGMPPRVEAIPLRSRASQRFAEQQLSPGELGLRAAPDRLGERGLYARRASLRPHQHPLEARRPASPPLTARLDTSRRYGEKCGLGKRGPPAD
jgi:hypothetical protein